MLHICIISMLVFSFYRNEAAMLHSRSKLAEIKLDQAIEVIRANPNLNSTEKVQIIYDLFDAVYSNLKKNDLEKQRQREKSYQTQLKQETLKQRLLNEQREQENKIYQKYLANRITGSSILKDFLVQRY